MDPDKNQYVYAQGISNCQVQWLKTENNQYPIIVEYGGKKIKVLPYKNGKETAKVKIDFTTGSPIINVGQEAN